ncbi:MAG: hypothetical protein JW783_04535 [Bacteroidales bacterium]|nr:hypothetical protein [Bacteroidales bacterium]MBN2749155.1 hypothetical protein [Bacteroidales bacterium]
MNVLSYNEVKQYLACFYEGESSLAQEEALKQYFRSASIHPDFTQDAMLFKELFAEAPSISRQDIGIKMLANIKQQRKPKTLIRLYATIGGVAAALAILFGGYSIYLATETEVKNTALLADTYSNPHEAYEATRDVLALFSAGLSSGSKELSRLEKVSIPSNAAVSVSSINEEISYLSNLSALSNSVSSLNRYTAYFKYFSHEEPEKVSEK